MWKSDNITWPTLAEKVLFEVEIGLLPCLEASRPLLCSHGPLPESHPMKADLNPRVFLGQNSNLRT